MKKLLLKLIRGKFPSHFTSRGPLSYFIYHVLLIIIDVKLRLNFRSYHRHSPRAKDPRRRVRIHRYWNEDFLVAVQFSKRQFNDLYVWRWKECQQPEFMYNYDLYNEYPQVIQIFQYCRN